MKVPLEGEVLAGKYRVERTLGKGGMGVVVAATHVHLRQPVAIKFLLENADEVTVTRFGREARAAVRLKSDHVARVLDVGELPDGAPYMVMEYLNGQDLSQVMRQQGPLSVPEAVLYLLHTCEAIAEAHSIGIIHRDLKPANLFLTRGADGENTVKVLDFGISKTQDEQTDGDQVHLTQTTAFLGSPLYMSPEQIKSPRGVTVRSDIWSLGAILYQLLAGQVPFKAGGFSELILMVNMEQPPPLAMFRSDVPPGLEAAIRRCLEKNPDARFQSVGALAWALFEYGPLEARASAEKIVRTLETVGVRVSRTTDTSGLHTAPSRPPPVASQSAIVLGAAGTEAAAAGAGPGSIAPAGPGAGSGSGAVPGASMPPLASTAGTGGRRVTWRGPLLISAAVITIGIAAGALLLPPRNPSPSPAPGPGPGPSAAPVVSVEVSQRAPTVTAPPTTMAVSNPQEVVPSASPLRQRTTSTTGSATSVKGAQLPPGRPAASAAPVAPTASAPGTDAPVPQSPTLKMKIKT